MNEPVDLSVYKETLLFLVTAGVVAPLFFRLRISPVLGYLLAGVALGPYGLGAIAQRAPWLSALAINVEAIDRIAAFGVVALMFTMGLELSFERLRRMRHLVFGLGLTQVVVTTLILAAAAWRLGLSPPSALAIGAALSMSSTAIVVPMLVESKRLHSGAGRASLAVLLFQDLAVAPLLVMTGALSAAGDSGLAWELLTTLVPAALVLTALVVFGRLALRPLFHFVAQTKSPEFFMAACLLVVLGAGLAAAASGPVDGARRLRRRPAAGRDRVPPRDRGDDRAVQGPAARPLLRLGRRRTRSRACCRAARGCVLVSGGVCRRRRRADAVRRSARLFRPPAPRRETCLLLGPGGEFAFVLVSAALAGGLVERTRPRRSSGGDALDVGDPGLLLARLGAAHRPAPAQRGGRCEVARDAADGEAARVHA